jgi:fermentation-respiration switch protein FrsA (DUF1100 family)
MIFTAAALLIIFIIIIFALPFYLCRKVIKPVVTDYDETFEMELELKRFTIEYYNSLPKEEIFIESPNGYKLHGIWVPLSGSKKTVILLHGFTYTLFGSVKYVEFFRKKGFNLLMPDSRYHGKSGGNNITFGLYEKYDVKAWIDMVIEKTGTPECIGIHAESMGASIAIQHASIDSRVSFYITDSIFSDMEDALAHRLKADYHLPPFPFIPAASLISRLHGAMHFRDISPEKIIPSLNVPVFFIHGSGDTYVPPAMSQLLYNKKKNNKKLWIAKGAEHSMSYVDHKEEYEKQMDEFLTFYSNSFNSKAHYNCAD